VNGLAYLTWRYLRRRPWPSALLAACLSIALLLPTVTHLLTSGFESALRERSAATPLVFGAAGPPLDLTLAGLYFSRPDLDTVPTGTWRELAAREDLLCVPLNLRASARSRPIVATVPEYFEERGLFAAEGHLPHVVGQAVLGASVAKDLELGVGDRLYSDPHDLIDMSKPSSLEMAVCGVLAPTGSADDRAVFTTLETAWVLEGLAHGHDEVDPETVDPDQVLGMSDEEVRLQPTFLSYRSLDGDALATFHLHDDPDELPLSCVLLFPRTSKAGTLVKAETNIERRYGASQVADTGAELDELLDLVLGLRRLLDAVAVLLFVATAALGALVIGLSMQLRANELRTLDRLGSSARTVTILKLQQVGAIAAVAAVAALAVLGLVWVLDPDLTLLL